MNLQRNYYEVLGVAPDATTQEIKQKYRELARKFHPDLVTDKALGVKVFSQVNQAYRILADPERRRDYDDAQSADRSKARKGRGPGSSVGSSTGSSAVVTPTMQRPAAPKLTESQVAQLDRSLNLADNAIMEGQADQARQLCEAILRIDSHNGRALSILGDAYVTLQRPEAAMKAYRAAMEISPSSMIEAKLRRLQNAPPPERGPTPATPNRPPASKPASGNGLFGKLIGRDKK